MAGPPLVPPTFRAGFKAPLPRSSEQKGVACTGSAARYHRRYPSGLALLPEGRYEAPPYRLHRWALVSLSAAGLGCAVCPAVPVPRAGRSLGFWRQGWPSSWKWLRGFCSPVSWELRHVGAAGTAPGVAPCPSAAAGARRWATGCVRPVKAACPETGCQERCQV